MPAGTGRGRARSWVPWALVPYVPQPLPCGRGCRLRLRTAPDGAPFRYETSPKVTVEVRFHGGFSKGPVPSAQCPRPPTPPQIVSSSEQSRSTGRESSGWGWGGIRKTRKWTSPQAGVYTQDSSGRPCTGLQAARRAPAWGGRPHTQPASATEAPEMQLG